uniref:ZP domain-containing protein n=1 Tax=Angiostrongylus cantonensis TaxID=6313 RepID=A0A158PAM2_ANGCA
MEFPTHSISDVSLNVCAEACTDDADVSTGHMCSSFEYDARSRECLVHADDGQPFGPSVLAKTNKSVAYFQKMCVIGEALCSSPYAFERFPQSILIGHAMKTAITGISTECRSVMYFYERGECIINRERRVDRPDLFVEDVQNQLVDYFENNCHDVQCLSGELHWVRTDEYFIELTSECRRSGVTVCLEFASPTSGSLYVKDNFGTCRLEFQNATYAELHIPFPRSDDPDPRCPGIEIAPLFWSFSIAVQKNEMDSPSLVTSTNRFFNVTCDFTAMLSREKEYVILQNGRAITTVLLGDEVTLKWTILDKTNGLDYFVDDCIAERVGGVAPHPEPLKIIQHGCPEKKVLNHLINSPIIRQLDGFSTKMKVFRFDGSRRVRIRCTIDVCVDYCGKVCGIYPFISGVGIFEKKARESWLRSSRWSSTL